MTGTATTAPELNRCKRCGWTDCPSLVAQGFYESKALWLQALQVCALRVLAKPCTCRDNYDLTLGPMRCPRHP